MTTTDLCTLADVRTVLAKSAGSTGSDDQITAYIPRASELLMEHTGREFVSALTAPATRSFRWDAGRVVTFDWRCDLRTLASITVDEGGAAPSPITLTADDYRFVTLNPRGGVHTQIEMRTGCAGRGRIVHVTGTWGFADVPLDVVQAAADTVAHWVRQLGFGGALADEAGMGAPSRTWALPGAAKDALDSWKRRSA